MCAGATCRPPPTSLRPWIPSIARTSGARPLPPWGLPRATFPKARHADPRPSSTARCSIRPTLRPISTASPSNRSPDPIVGADPGPRPFPARPRKDRIMTATIQRLPSAAAPLASESAGILALPRPAPRPIAWTRALSAIAADVLPPLIVLGLVLVVWQILCASPGASLPAPSQVWVDASELIVSPFFDYGQGDIGLGLRVLTSLQRVAIGFGIAAVVG